MENSDFHKRISLEFIMDSRYKNHRKNTTKGSDIGNDKEIYPPDEVGALEIWAFTSISLDISEIGFWFCTADWESGCSVLGSTVGMVCWDGWGDGWDVIGALVAPDVGCSVNWIGTGLENIVVIVIAVEELIVWSDGGNDNCSLMTDGIGVICGGPDGIPDGIAVITWTK